MLQHSLQLNQIVCVSKVVISRLAFSAAIKIGLPEAMKQHPDFVPIIHISAHGDGDGLQMSNGEKLDWEELKALLRPVNEALKNTLFVCMSACQGYSGIKMAMSFEDEAYPYFALIGCAASPTWAETSIGFCTLYHLMNKGETIMDALKVMRAASGVDSWNADRAADSRTFYRDYISKKQLEQAQETLKDDAAAASSSESSTVVVPVAVPLVGQDSTPKAPELSKFVTRPISS